MNFHLELYLAVQDAKRYQKEKASVILQNEESTTKSSTLEEALTAGDFQRMLSGIVTITRRSN